METSEISDHQARVFMALSDKAWLSAREAAMRAVVAHRTARAHLLRFVQLGIADQAELFPAHKYRLSDLAEKRNKAFLERMHTACRIFGYMTEQA